jgi:hypothetical protein
LALRCPRSRIDGMGGQVSEFIWHDDQGFKLLSWFYWW